MPPKVIPKPPISGKPIAGYSKDPATAAVYGQHTADGTAIEGFTGSGSAIYGWSQDGQGVYGESANGEGIRGVSHSAHGGVVGVNSSAGQGVYGESTKGEGVRGVSGSAAHAGVVGVSTNPSGVGVYGEGGRLAAQFHGDVEVTGDIRLTGGADCAEEFAITSKEDAEPGTVMVLGTEGTVLPGSLPYDKRVVGVVSGAGEFKPAIILGKKESNGSHAALALIGRVFCKVDASYGAVEIGDLLTTSRTLGHAMKVSDTSRAFGCVIGKALRPLAHGTGVIPIVVALQ